MDWFIWFCIAYTVIRVGKDLSKYLEDRSGNSGRTKHWSEEY